MAKKSSPSAPGTYTSGGVRCTLDPPFNKASKGSQQNMDAPFDAPRVGGSELPTKIYDSLGGPKSTPKPGVYQSSPSAQGPTRAGAK